jgi:hypothetical protein
MDKTAGNHDRPTRRHLLTPDEVKRGATASTSELTGTHRQGNGLRTHGIYFAAVSLAALILLVALIAFVPVRM